MPLTRCQIEQVARLAKLALTEEEKTLYQEQLSTILEYAGRLQAVDTSTVPPPAGEPAPQNVVRADVPGPSLPPQAVLANAPAEQDGYLCVPALME